MLVLLFHLWVVLGTAGNMTHEIDPVVYDNSMVYSKHTFLRGDEYEGFYTINFWRMDCKKKKMTRIKYQLFNSNTDDLVGELDIVLEVPFVKGTYADYASKEYWCK